MFIGHGDNGLSRLHNLANLGRSRQHHPGRRRDQAGPTAVEGRRVIGGLGVADRRVLGFGLLLADRAAGDELGEPRGVALGPLQVRGRLAQPGFHRCGVEFRDRLALADGVAVIHAQGGDDPRDPERQGHFPSPLEGAGGGDIAIALRRADFDHLNSWTRRLAGRRLLTATTGQHHAGGEEEDG